ncbi:ras-GEF domain-containing family member 1B-like isoform X3 [Harmonia axyridis]|uniref:ras-GEF domain-containing family member 1B-like isoform X3 n=2 Tax=Harmonia axyridis TaxID=115357 RepID=UPI001E277E57|nr:ras-GEF domain-containing family member 1B-like isoform X3 [Harmonia axyridis]
MKMGPIENALRHDFPAHDGVELRTVDRSRDLFGVQLEVTSLLLEAERRKLSVLQKELHVALEEGGSIKAKEHQKQELITTITRIQAQHDHLDREYRECALGALLSANTRGSGKSNRSQPAIGLKHTPKSRPTIFGTVASDHTLKDCSGSRRCLPQTPHTKSFSSNYNGDGAPENGDDSSIQQEHTLVYRDGNLLSGSLDALIQHMVPTDTYYPDRAYIFAFLLSSRLFIKPHDLLAKIRNFYEIQQGLNNSMGAGNPGRTRFAEHLVDLLAEWTETFPYDFRDERVMQHVQTMTQQCCILNPSLRTNVSSILHNLLQRLTSLETYEKSLEKSQVPLEDFTDDITEICPFPSTLAQQLTQLELERLSFIGPEEFVQAFAKENPLLETSFKDMKKTRNLEQYVQWFNRLSYFVATQVCKYQKKKQRVRMMEYWIETGRECFNIGNFNSLMAIISGLNMSPISRLKKTWNKIHSGKFAILEHQMDPSSNFSSYRSTLKAAMWRSAGATDQRQRIVIPFFSLLVKDLYFLNQGCSNRLPNGHINFEKFWQLAKQVTEFMAWKQVACPFERDVRILSLLQHGTILNENSLALASFDCEPPENNQEKERCKSLKADSTTTL